MLASLASAAPVPVRIGDRDFMLSPLSDRDFDELSLWYQGRVLKMARASLDSDSTPEERDETLRAAYAFASGIDFLSEFRGVGLLAEKEVLAQFVWRLFRKQQKFTLDDAREMVQSGQPLGNVMDAWHLAQYGKAPKEESAENPEKNAGSGEPIPEP